jgi:hypothetical protein
LDGTGFIIGQPLPFGEIVDGQRWVTKPLPYGYDEDRAFPVSIDGGIEQPQRTGPTQIIKKTNFNLKQPQPSVSKIADEKESPAVGQQGAN